METWRLLDTGPHSGAENMAIDEALLEWKAAEKIPHALRFLQFSTPTGLVGHHQSVEEEVRLDTCRAHGIDINRRLTGGGALYWGEMNWAGRFISPKKIQGFPPGLRIFTERWGRHPQGENHLKVPNLDEISKISAIARILNPGIPIRIGCVRPAHPWKAAMRKGAIDSGINTIAYPLQGTMDYAKEIGLNTKFIEMCCSLI